MGGCGSSHVKGYPDTPYSKKISKNLVRFWAEVFLLAQKGGGGGKWELVLPKLVPVNVARIQDTPSALSHVTAYNTKVDKVLDALISYPEMELYRGSPCFVYWADPARAVTWGLNFLTPQDADAYTLLICGKDSGLISRRANSATSLASKKQHRQRSTSIPNADGFDTGELRRSLKVKWADEPSSKSVETTPMGSRRSLAEEADPFTLYMTGKRLSDWRTMLPAEPVQAKAPTRAPRPVPPPRISEPSKLGGSAEQRIWEEKSPPKMNVSLDSHALQRMLNPLNSGGESSSSAIVSPALQSAEDSPGRPPLRIPQQPQSANVVLRQNKVDCSVRSARRSSLHLQSGGAFPRRVAEEETLSLSSSLSSQPSSSRQSPTTSTPKRLRKAGFLLVRKWIVAKDGDISLAEGGWHHYWAILKGLHLHMYAVKEGLSPEQQPSDERTPVVYDLLNCLMTAVPEYPKRQHVLCLSLGSGEAVLAQAASEAELEEWVGLVHAAAALALARTTSPEVALRTLRKDLDKLEAKIGTVNKMIRLSELPSVGTVSVHALGDWEQELQLLALQAHMSRSYVAALRRSEPPSSKRAMGCACLETKNFLSQIGAFTISSLHAYVLARTGKAGLCAPSPVPTPPCRPPNSPFPKEASPDVGPNIFHVTLPNGQVIRVAILETEMVKDVLKKICAKVPLEPKGHFILLRRGKRPSECLIPNETDVLLPLLWEYGVELRERLVYHVDLGREGVEVPLGLTVRAVRQGGEGTASVTEIAAGSQARRRGLEPGDELLAVNGHWLKGLASVQVERLLQKGSRLCLVLRTQRESLPPPLRALPANFRSLRYCESGSEAPVASTSSPEDQPQSIAVRFRAARGVAPGEAESASVQSSPYRYEPNHSLYSSGSVDGGSGDSTSSAPLTPHQRLQKLVAELLLTEKNYVQDLEQLESRYLGPLSKRSELGGAFGCGAAATAAEIRRFQRGFLEELEEAAGGGGAAEELFPSAAQERDALLRLGGIFLNAAQNFRLYSPFCAANWGLQKLLSSEHSEELDAFLESCNEEKQHSRTLDSFLIKPVQRVLRYPLFLSQMKTLTAPGSHEHAQISEALTKMEKVAEYINEMQRVYEEYGDTFAKIQARNDVIAQKKLSVGLGELVMFGEVEWVNWGAEGRSKGGIEAVCFLFRSAILLLPRPTKATKKQQKGASPELHERVIPLQEVEINGSDVGSTDGRHVWVLIHMNASTERIYHLANRRAETKAEFLRAIRKGATRSEPRRPGSFYSSQSDAGYASNGELASAVAQKKAAAAAAAAAATLPQVVN